MSVKKNPYDPAIKTSLGFDTKYCWTDDLPSLRYKGVVKVFLWDDMQDLPTLATTVGRSESKIALDLMSDCYYYAKTKDKFLPWYSLDKGGTYTGYCLEEPEDLLFLDAEQHVISDPAQMMGTMFNCGLDLIQDLDSYYESTLKFYRVKIKVFPTPGSTTTVEAYTWLNDLDQLTDDCPTTGQTKLKSGMDLVPFRDKEGTGGDGYVYAFAD